MEGWQIAIVLKPFGVLLIFAAIIPVELALRRLWPEWALKRILFDRTFRDRRPVAFMAVWLALMVLLWTAIGFYLRSST